MLELEKTYLVKSVPTNLTSCKSKEIIDIYLPQESAHPTLRLRKNGQKYEMTKKQPVAQDASEQIEQTIILTEQEFVALSHVQGKKVHKIRYYYPCQGRTAEVDVFQGDLQGLVLADFEFEQKNEKDAFIMPAFCLADVSNETFLAGGMLCGKRYSDLAVALKRFEYKSL